VFEFIIFEFLDLGLKVMNLWMKVDEVVVEDDEEMREEDEEKEKIKCWWFTVRYNISNDLTVLFLSNG